MTDDDAGNWPDNVRRLLREFKPGQRIRACCEITSIGAEGVSEIAEGTLGMALSRDGELPLYRIQWDTGVTIRVSAEFIDPANERMVDDVPPRVWKTRERCQLTYEGRKVPAIVLLASSNGRALMMKFEAVLGQHVGMMPLLYEHGAFRSLVTDQVATLEEP